MKTVQAVSNLHYIVNLTQPELLRKKKGDNAPSKISYFQQ